MEPIQHSAHRRKKNNSTKVNLAISIAVHGLMVAAGAYWAAHEGVLGKRIQELSVMLVPKEKKPEPAKQEEKKVEPAKVETKSVEQAKASAAPKVAPPPVVDTSANVAAPPPAMPTIDFGDLVAKTDSGDGREAYRQHIENAIRARWSRPDNVPDIGYVAEVNVYIDTLGKVTRYEMAKTSGEARWDDSVKKAVEATKTIGRTPPNGFPDHFLVRFDTVPTTETIAMD